MRQPWSQRGLQPLHLQRPGPLRAARHPSQPDDTVAIAPLVPPEWDYFAVENLAYHGHNLSVLGTAAAGTTDTDPA
ncbi:glycosyl hydrolase family 65 protein [Streptomyces sp. NPDC057616]|uniref:glycosyl hydrolase family 65 protein n=1 Tax=Streptomyces sp. NPDC057616 TaxID=3346183 RepID=UPI0036B08A1D